MTGPRARSVWDIALSILLLILTALIGVFGALLATVTFATLGTCVGDCSLDGATSALFLAGAAAVIVVAAGVIGTVVALVHRRRAWWVALLTLIGVILVWVAGFLLYGVAVSG
ncbi:MAG: hypothetical protein CMF56_10200 [Leifsonia sp.]|nr:hypothetical protein [Leifsonia sp.]